MPFKNFKIKIKFQAIEISGLVMSEKIDRNQKFIVTNILRQHNNSKVSFVKPQLPKAFMYLTYVINQKVIKTLARKLHVLSTYS